MAASRLTVEAVTPSPTATDWACAFFMLSAALGPNADDSASPGLNAKAGRDIVAMMPVATVMTPTLRIQPPLRLAGLPSFAAGADFWAAAAAPGRAAAGAFAVWAVRVARSDRRETSCDPEADVVDDVEARVSGS
ncbi:hypothetical protein LSHI6S_01560 [Leifsonia shinshuensis]